MKDILLICIEILKYSVLYLRIYPMKTGELSQDLVYVQRIIGNSKTGEIA